MACVDCVCVRSYSFWEEKWVFDTTFLITAQGSSDLDTAFGSGLFKQDAKISLRIKNLIQFIKTIYLTSTQYHFYLDEIICRPNVTPQRAEKIGSCLTSTQNKSPW